MTSSVLHILQRDAGFTRTGDEEDPQRVGPDLTSAVERHDEPGGDHPPRLRLIHATTGLGDEQRASRAAAEILVDRSYNRSGEDGSIAAAALALQAQDPMPSVVREICSTSRFRASPTRTPVCASRLSRAMLRRLPYSLAAAIRRRNSSRVSPGVSPRSAIFGRRTSFAGDIGTHLFGDEEVVPARHRRQSASDRPGFQVELLERPGPGVDVRPPSTQRFDAMLVAEREPRREVAAVAAPRVLTWEAEEPCRA